MILAARPLGAPCRKRTTFILKFDFDYLAQKKHFLTMAKTKMSAAKKIVKFLIFKSENAVSKKF